MAARCRSCPAEIVWAKMPSGALNPLDVVESDPVSGVVALHGPSGRGIVLSNENLDKADEWRARGDVTFHLSHFATCPNSKAHKRTKETLL